MANTPPNLLADGTIRTSRFVKIGTEDFEGLEADANEKIIGISQDGSRTAPLSDVISVNEAAQDGESFRLFGDGEQCLLEAGGSFSAGGLLKSDADGKAVAIATSGTTLQRYGAVALQDSGGDGEKVQVQVDIGSERPAIA